MGRNAYMQVDGVPRLHRTQIRAIEVAGKTQAEAECARGSAHTTESEQRSAPAPGKRPGACPSPQEGDEVPDITQLPVRNDHAVYIARDEDGVPIYVGYSSQVFARIGSHQAQSEWWQYAATLEIEWHDNKGSGLRRERELIEHHQPEHNTQHRDADSLYLQRMIGRLKCSHCPLPATHIHCNTAICENCREVYGLWNSMSIEKALRDRQLDHAAGPLTR